VDKDKVEAVVLDAVKMLLLVGLVTLLALGAIGYVLSRLMMGSVPKLARTMKAVAEGDDQTEVPCITRGNEVGEMARAVDVFRESALNVSQSTEDERAASQRRRTERTDMMVALPAAFRAVVDAAIAGDSSKRVHAQFPDPALNALA